MSHHEILSKGTIALIIHLIMCMKIVVSQNRPAKCFTHNSSEGFLVANCTDSPYDSKYTTLPSDLPKSIEVVDFGTTLLPDGKSRWCLITILPQTFKPYDKLQHIIIKYLQYLVEKGKLNFEVKWVLRTTFETIFSDIKTLQILEFTHSGLYDDYVLYLPASLKTLVLDYNNYESLSVEWCENIEEISAEHNDLKNIPKLHYSGPPLKKLNLKQNPLNEMTILDIAPLCELELLELNFTAGTHYAQERGYCDCVMLKKWATEVLLAGLENLKCVEPKDKKSCSDKIIQDATSKRKKCPLLKKGDVVSNKMYHILLYVFLFILFLLLLTAIILYVIRHYHLKEWAAQHMAALHAAPPKTEEEGEEENSLQGQTSISSEEGVAV